MRRSTLTILSSCLVAACSVTNTGNPAAHGGSAPEGISLVRSDLARNTMPDASQAELKSFGEDRRDFAFALYGTLKDGADNVFYSPHSISTALAMTYAGAKGETEREMASALHFQQPAATLHAAFNATDLALTGRAHELVESMDPGGEATKGDGFTLRVNNALFAQKGLSLQDPFLNVLATDYDAGVYLADFASNPERERMAINGWVADQTEQRIDKLLPEGSIDANTALVLTNAVYFKASWLQKFDPKMTAAAPFHAANGDVSVPMMHGGYDKYYRGVNYQAVELPYVSDAVRMLLILPDEGKLAEVESGLDRALFDEARTSLSQYSVNLRLPRFSFRMKSQLSSALKTLGMRRAFGAQADFSGMAGSPGELYIDEVYHEAFVAVDENGTEAAAATAVVLRELSILPSVSITFDRPFLFFVYDEPTGQILFGGRLSTPAAG